MTRSVTDLMHEIRALTPEDQRDLLAALVRELNGTAPGPQVAELWLAEAQRRFRELVEGKVEAVPGRVVFERLRSRLAGS